MPFGLQIKLLFCVWLLILPTKLLYLPTGSFWSTRLQEPETYGKLLVTLQVEELGKEYTVRKIVIQEEKLLISKLTKVYKS